MFNILKKSFEILRNNLILVQPFILFLFLISIFLGSISNIKNGFSPILVSFLISIFALTGAFLAGWLQLFQAAIRNHSTQTKSPVERAEMSLGILREFLPAVGRFFVPITIAMILYIALFFGLLKLALFLGLKYIGFSDNLSPDKLIAVFNDKTKAYAFISTLTTLDRIKLMKWDFLFLITTGIFSYLTMLWFPAIMINGENPFKAFFSGIKALLKKPLVSIGIFGFYWCVNLFVSLIGSLLPGFFIVQLLNLMLAVFVAVYFIMVSFIYFEEYSGNNIAGWTNIFR